MDLVHAGQDSVSVIQRIRADPDRWPRQQSTSVQSRNGAPKGAARVARNVGGRDQDEIALGARPNQRRSPSPGGLGWVGLGRLSPLRAVRDGRKARALCPGSPKLFRPVAGRTRRMWKPGHCCSALLCTLYRSHARGDRQAKVRCPFGLVWPLLC
jgi:hypothetical protein